MESFLSADACAPESFVDGVFHLGEVGYISVIAQIVDLIFAGEGHVACGSDDLDLRCEYLEREVEAHLVVSGSGRSVRYGVGSDLLGVFDYGDGLEYAFGAD